MLPQLLERLRTVLDGAGVEWEAVLVDDGSKDETWARIREAAAADPRFRGLRLSRNFGHQPALSAGLDASRGDAVVIMDGDLQHPPELIPQLLEKAGEGYDVVYAVRSTVDDSTWFKRESARLFYTLFNRLSGLGLPHSGGDFRYMSRRVVDILLAMPERRRFLRGMTRWIGFEQGVVEYTRVSRAAGESKYTLRKMVGFAWDALTSFSSIPLQAASLFGVIVSFLGWLYFVYVLAIRLFTDSAVPGWSSVVIAVLILGGVQLVCLGVIGQYLGRVYDETKARPLYVVAEATPPDGAPVSGGDA